MSAESPATMAFRVLVMLFFVVAIPVAALVGTPLTSWVQKVLEHQLGIEFGAGAKVETADAPPSATPPQPVQVPANAMPAPQPVGGAVQTNYVPAPQEVAPNSGDPAGAKRLLESNDFSAIQTHLRQLGAVHSQLETWGADGKLYRFHCRVSLNGSQNLVRFFEARHADPAQAMAEVMRQVEAWRQGR